MIFYCIYKFENSITQCESKIILLLNGTQEINAGKFLNMLIYYKGNVLVNCHVDQSYVYYQ